MAETKAADGSISVDSTSKTKSPKAGDPNVVSIPVPSDGTFIGIPMEGRTGKPGEKYRVEVKKSNGKVRVIESH